MNESAAHPVENQVLAARRRISEAFAARDGADREHRTPAEACLVTILDTLGWTGDPRHIFEAMPHLGRIENVAVTRAVLQRLSVRTERLDVEPHRLQSYLLPCLLDAPDGPKVLLSMSEAGTFKVFDGQSSITAEKPARELIGSVYRTRLADAEVDGAEARQISWVLSLMLSNRTGLLRAGLLSFGINLLVPLVPLFVMSVYDKAIGTRSVDTLVMLTLGILCAIALEQHLRTRRSRQLAAVGARFDAVIAIAAFAKVLHLPLSMNESAALGRQLARFKQFEVAREIFQGRLVAAVFDLPFTLLFFILIFALGGSLGFVPLGLAVVIAVMAAVAAPVASGYGRLSADAKTRSDQVVVEIATKLRAIREAGAEAAWHQRAGVAYAEYLRDRQAGNRSSALLNTLTSGAGAISGCLVLGIGAERVIEGTMTIGALIAVMAVAWRVLSPIQDVLLALPRLKQTLATVRQIDQLMKLRPERDPAQLPALKRRFSGALAAQGVAFRYPLRQELVLRGLSISIRPGEFVTVTGPSGTGKSTLLKLFIGLYQPQAGGVLVDGLDLRQLDLGDLRRSCAYLQQNTTLFHGTVAQNLRFVAPEASDAELIEALARFDVTFPNPLLPEGLETRVTTALREQWSGALLQRLLLARTFVAPRPIILLDEPANYLDRRGDEQLLSRISEARGRSTIVMVTARPSHMNASDRVIVLADGTVAAQGPPEVLVPKILAPRPPAAASA